MSALMVYKRTNDLPIKVNDPAKEILIAIDKATERGGIIMRPFETLNINYEDIIQMDGAFSSTHFNYKEPPLFYDVDGKETIENSKIDNLSTKDSLEDVIGNICIFDGTEQGFKLEERISLWKHYWLEYIDVFDRLSKYKPNSVVTIYVGRHAIELGLKYLLLKKTGGIDKIHDLGELSKRLFDNYNINDSYMRYVDDYCDRYCKYIEGGNVEYFRFPEYKKNKYFAGNHLSINWLSYNFSLILLKLLHFAGLDEGELFQ